MTETFKNPIELEIEALSKEIEAKRRELEAGVGVVHESTGEKEVVRASLAEKINAQLPPSIAPLGPVPVAPAASSTGSYLDDLDPETTEKVNALIQEVFDKGLERAIKDAKNLEPYVLDAFHDALADRMYQELKRRKVIN